MLKIFDNYYLDASGVCYKLKKAHVKGDGKVEYDFFTYHNTQEEALAEEIPIVPHETARFLSTLLTIKKPKEILEIGTAVAFSAGLMSRYLQEGGHVTTIDRYEYMLNIAKKNIKRMGLEEKINIIEDDASNVLPKLSGPYDFIFLDAAKAQYIHFLPEVMRLMKKGAVLITDNVLQEGDIIQSKYVVRRRDRTIHKRMREYLEVVKNHPELETTIVPIGDGITISVKK